MRKRSFRRLFVQLAAPVVQQIVQTRLELDELDEQQRRWHVATLAEQYGLRKGWIRELAQITGMNEKTIRIEIKEMQGGLKDHLT